MVRKFLLAALFMAICSFEPQHANADDATVLPAVSREWHGSDYKTVATAISKGKISLPKLSDQNTAAIFRKFVSSENLAPLQNKILSTEYRINEITLIISSAAALLKPYLEVANHGEKVNSEVALLMAFMLRATTVQVALVNEFLPKIPHDATYATRMEGLAMIRHGATNAFLGLVTSLSERPFYSDNDISLMLQAMADTLPSLKTMFAQDVREELRNKLQLHRAKATRSNDITNLDYMLVELKI